MKRASDYEYVTSGGAWSKELVIMFVGGFLLATMLWLAVWFFHSRPAYAGALQMRRVELQGCLKERATFTQQRAKMQAENKQLNAKLEEALLGWGRCIKSENHSNSAEQDKAGEQ